MKGAREISLTARRSHTLFTNSFWDIGGNRPKPPCRLTNGPWLKQLSSLSGGVADKSLHVYKNQSAPRRVHQNALGDLA